MFRCFALSLVLGLLGLGCGDDGANNGADLSQNLAPDLAVADDSCAAALDCTRTQCTAANAQTCGFACAGSVSATAQPLLQAIIDCIDNQCTSLGGDGGTSDCNDPQSSACASCVQSRCASQAADCLSH
jgi:hypothetical protein